MPLDWKTAYAAMHARGEAEFPPAGLHYLLELSRQACRTRNRPVTPPELWGEFQAQTRRDFGPWAREVLADWGLITATDLGRAVILLGRHGCLTLEPGDTLEAFSALEAV